MLSQSPSLPRANCFYCRFCHLSAIRLHGNFSPQQWETETHTLRTYIQCFQPERGGLVSARRDSTAELFERRHRDSLQPREGPSKGTATAFLENMSEAKFDRANKDKALQKWRSSPLVKCIRLYWYLKTVHRRQQRSGNHPKHPLRYPPRHSWSLLESFTTQVERGH
ncbi:hypothetical protein P170DRAFT_174835 [Aspergillus steynii IBT 23096]|uniref:Uncharacterized protein n=1 Tax=Aspergillus steynii IBT 23096 TaxID=1392250 RepID=A0A2I2G8A1_9EURO|nr:uncharacterized protein P170DRAFT_174835 [Aspergillus steynii IBT 23096]PLB49094.1 hypothetical protein P170DRAFT_174835 [Aspergillus steynii IBT 23096]